MNLELWRTTGTLEQSITERALLLRSDHFFPFLDARTNAFWAWMGNLWEMAAPIPQLTAVAARSFGVKLYRFFDRTTALLWSDPIPQLQSSVPNTLKEDRQSYPAITKFRSLRLSNIYWLSTLHYCACQIDSHFIVFSGHALIGQYSALHFSGFSSWYFPRKSSC